jgi:4-amino-4-deoxy-L-arabinose transferase-like glycosyltransferase
MNTGEPAVRRLPPAALCALLLWNAWLLVYFLGRFFVPPAMLANAAGQYLVWDRFSARTLAGNWWRFGSGAVALAGMAAAAWLGGTVLAGWARRRAPPTVALALGFGMIGSAALGLGLAGLLFAPPKPVSLAVLALLAGWQVRRARNALRLILAGGSTSGETPWVVSTLVLAAALAIATVGVLNIEMAWDALTYHLRLPSFYIYRHKFYDVWHHYCAPFPSQIEMLYLVCQMVHGDFLARMLNALFGVLLVLSVPGLARAAGARGSLAVVLVCGNPVFLVLLDRAYLDLGFALFISLALREILVAGRHGVSADAWVATTPGGSPDGEPPKTPTVGLGAVVTGGLLAGFGLASKYVGALALPGFLLASLSGRRSARWPRNAALWAAAASVPVLAWLLKNWAMKGNPVSPLLGGLFGTHEMIPGDITPLFSRAHPWSALLGSLPERIEAVFADSGRVDGPLAPFVAGLLPLLAVARLGERARPLAGFLLGYGAGWLVLAPDVRFLLPALPAFAVLAADAVPRAVESARREVRLAFRTLIEAGVIAGALYGASTTWVFADPLAMPLGLASVRDRLQFGLPPAPFMYYTVARVNETVPRGERVWYLSNPFTYYVERECVADFHFGVSQFTRLAREARSAQGMAKRFRQLGFRWLLSTGPEVIQYSAFPDYFSLPEATWGEFKRLLATRAETAWQTEHFTLYRLGPAHPPRALPALPIREALWWTRADKDLSDGRAREALAAFLSPPPLLADVGSTFVRQGDALMTAGEFRRAEAAFRKALALGADNPRIRTGLSQALQRQGRPREALEHSEAGWRESPLSAYAAASLAINLNALGRVEDARHMIREAIRLRPDEADYREIAKRLGAE